MQDRMSISRHAGAQSRNSVAWRHTLWLSLLVAASVVFSFGFACAVPFAAFGAIAALTLSRRDALLLTVAVWLANQLVGFAFLNYPWTASTLAWGVILGAVAVLSTVAARGTARQLERRAAAVVSLGAFAGAFIAYEGGLFLVSATLMGGTENFLPAIVFRILAINAAAFLGLLVLNRLAVIGGLVTRPASPYAVAAHGYRAP